MAITTEQIKQLRQETDAGILDCRTALEQADGDYSKALEFLREKGLSKIEKRADREASEGVVELYSHGNGRVGVMVELNCETDFVARSERFRKLAHELALQIAAFAPQYVSPEDIPADVKEESARVWKAEALAEGKPENIVERIVEGRMKKFEDEVCLIRQAYVRDDEITINQLILQNVASMGEKVVIRRFARWELGENTAD